MSGFRWNIKIDVVIYQKCSKASFDLIFDFIFDHHDAFLAHRVPAHAAILDCSASFDFLSGSPSVHDIANFLSFDLFLSACLSLHCWVLNQGRHQYAILCLYVAHVLTGFNTDKLLHVTCHAEIVIGCSACYVLIRYMVSLARMHRYRSRHDNPWMLKLGVDMDAIFGDHLMVLQVLQWIIVLKTSKFINPYHWRNHAMNRSCFISCIIIDWNSMVVLRWATLPQQLLVSPLNERFVTPFLLQVIFTLLIILLILHFVIALRIYFRGVS